MSQTRGGTWRGRVARSPQVRRFIRSLGLAPLARTGAWAGSLALALTSASPAFARQCVGQWVSLTPPLAPSARQYYAAAYDEARERVVLFAGQGGSPLRDTWEWDGATWTLVANNVGPSARYNASMVYDPARQCTLLVGGQGQSGVLNDVWAWDGGAWTMLNNAAPSWALRPTLAFDRHRGKIVLFCGWTDPATATSQTWEWDSATNVWSQVMIPGPAPRQRHAMAYDALHRQIVLFGGLGFSLHADTWVYDGAQWTQRIVAGPSARSTAAMAYDSVRNRTVLFGGLSAGELGDTWEWTGAAWILRATTGPSPRHRLSAVFDAARNENVLFGGFDGVGVTNQTWVWAGGDAPVFSSHPSPVAITTGADAFFVASASGVGAVQYRWRHAGVEVADGVGPRGEIISGSASPTLSIVWARSIDAGAYDCVATDDCGASISAPATLEIGCPGDVNGDTLVNFSDLNTVISAFGQTGVPGTVPGDVNGDGTVNFADLNVVLSNFGLLC